MKFKIWLMAFRPKTLTAAVVPILAATALSYKVTGSYSTGVLILALVSAVAIQIATNLFNDAIDFKKGADTEKRIGPTRVTQSGMVSQKTTMKAAIIMLVLAAMAGLPLVYWGGYPILVIGIISALLAYSYTGGPFPLAYLGLGDLFVILFFGLIAVAGVYYLHTATVTIAAVVLGLQLGLLSTVLIAINNYRDAEQDVLVGKKTLAVRFGPTFMRFEILLLILSAFLLQFYWYLNFGFWVALLPLLCLPIALKVVWSILRVPPGPIFNLYLAQSALLHASFGIIISLGLVLS